MASGAGEGDYIARILKGTSPAGLNLTAARQLRLKFPQSPLARADEALE